ncbi:MAG: Beta-galactosidase C-terminal domain [Burkholderiales bacterium]|nr:Beta-galactosidase C-terminal domain [Opitutaceae bacterium]
MRAPLGAPEGVAVCERHAPDGAHYTFLLNHGDAPAIVSDSSLHGRELLSARDVVAPLVLPPLGVAIVRR